MRIDDDSICVNINSIDFRNVQIEHIQKNLVPGFEPSSTKYLGLMNKIDFLNQKGFRTLVFSETTKNNLDDYSVPKEIRLEVLRSLPNRKDTIQIDQHNCLKYMKDDNYIRGILCFRRRTPIRNKDIIPNDDIMIHINYFSIDLENGHLFMDDRFTYGNIFLNRDLFIEKIYSQFMVVVTYLELTEVDLKLVENINSKNRKEVPGITNQSRYNVIYVNSNWNTRTISLNTISVRGHYRLQPYGVGRSQYKFIYIEPFQKGLMKRLSQKELV